MKILFITEEFHPYPGGVATYVHSSAETARNMGHDVTVCVVGTRSGLLESLDDYKYSIFYLSKKHYKKSHIPLLSYKLHKYLQNNSFDKIIFSDYKSLILSLLLPKKIKFSTIIHGTEVRGRFLILLSNIFIRPLSRCENIFANSEFTRASALECHSYLNSDRVKVNYLGPPLKSNIYKLASTKIKTSPETELTMCSLGRIEKRKGIHVFLQVLSKLNTEIKLTYNVIGRVVDEEYYDEIKEMTYLLPDNVTVNFCGALSAKSLNKVLNDSDFMVHTSIPCPVECEGFGLVLLEFAALGKAVLATNTDAIPEVVRDGETGFLCSWDDIEDMKGKLELLINDKEQRFRMGEQAFKNLSRFSWDSHVVGLLYD